MNWAPYQGARNCTGGPTPGARALQAWLDEVYEGYSLGIYVCRTVRGSTTANSMHSEGRALDWGLRMPAPGRANPVGHTILRHLAAHGARLGIQCIIWDRRIYSGASPSGRYYGGVSPHYDHLHIELNWDGARNLTLATLRAVLGGSTQPAPIEEDDDMGTNAYHETVQPGAAARIGIPPPDQPHTGEVWVSLSSDHNGAEVRAVRGSQAGWAGLGPKGVWTFRVPSGRHFAQRCHPKDQVVSVTNKGPEPVGVLVEVVRR